MLIAWVCGAPAAVTWTRATGGAAFFLAAITALRARSSGSLGQFAICASAIVDAAVVHVGATDHAIEAVRDFFRHGSIVVTGAGGTGRHREAKAQGEHG